MTSDSIRSPDEVDERAATRVSVDWLKMDRENPRLVNMADMPTQEGIAARLYRAENLRALLLSISASGCMDIEPLIVLLDAADRKFIVLDGNHRLAAIRLFREPRLVEAIERSEGLKINVPEIDDRLLAGLARVSVYRVPSRAAARSFIGFKHMNGTARWDFYAKARFTAEWYRSGEASLEQIADKLGAPHEIIKRMVAAFYVLDQARELNVFQLEDRKTVRFNFSHLYLALSRSSYMEYLGLEATWFDLARGPDPIRTDKLKRLREVLVWLYGSKEDDREPVVRTQNPHIKMLGEVLESAEGAHVLRTGASLEQAHASIQPASETLSRSLFLARGNLREAETKLRGYDAHDRSLLYVAEDVSETARAIFKRMRKKFRDAAENALDG